MTAKKVFFAAVFAMWSWCGAQAQTPYPVQSPYLPGAAQPKNGAVETPMPQNRTAPTTTEVVHEGETGLSSWITYDRPCCNGHGGGMPILTELFVRIGPDIPVGGERMGHALDVGWMIEGGGRAMFFDRTWTRAIGVELSISNHYNSSQDPTTILLKNTKKVVSIHSFDRTFVNLGIGPEFYFGTPAISDGAHLRVGADIGGRYGAAVAQFNEIRHRTDVIGGFYAALHTDLEIPCGRCTYLGGVRLEYGYTWSDILEGTADMQDIMVLFNFGVRF